MNAAASVDADQPIRAAIHLRIGQDRPSLARLHRWEVVATYVDQSKPATDKTKQPAYGRMVADYEAGRFSAIVCYDLTV